MGAPRSKIFGLLLTEGVLLSLTGTIIGSLTGHLAAAAFSVVPGAGAYGSFSGWRYLPEEGYILAAGLLAGIISAAIPAWQASRTDIHRVLAR